MKGIRRLDNFIATPAYIVVLITGVLMVFGGVVSFQTGWVVASLALYVVLVVLGMAFSSPRAQAADRRGGKGRDERGLHGGRATHKHDRHAHDCSGARDRCADGHETVLRPSLCRCRDADSSELGRR